MHEKNCTNVALTIMSQYGEVCSVFKPIMYEFLISRDNLMDNRYCEFSKHENGYGYVGSFLYDKSEHSIPKPSVFSIII